MHIDQNHDIELDFVTGLKFSKEEINGNSYTGQVLLHAGAGRVIYVEWKASFRIRF